jgi:DNA-binding CsgD family transcriptional regulator
MAPLITLPTTAPDDRPIQNGFPRSHARLQRAAAPALTAVCRELGDPAVTLLLTDRRGRVIDRWTRGAHPGRPAIRPARVARSAGAVTDPGTGSTLGVIAMTYPGWVWQPPMRALIGRMVHETGERLLSDVLPLGRVPAKEMAWPSLTRSEQNVVDYVAKGFTNRETAEKLFVSAHTVDYHLRRVFQKLGLSSRVELAHLVSSSRLT